MLSELCIENFVLIDHLSVSFGPGLNVLSGETGAGKSIVVQALNLLLGGRASAGALRDGAEQAVVEGLFVVEQEPWIASELEKMGIEANGELWVRRLIPRGGRGRAFLNGSPVPLSVLKKLAPGLVDFSSQNEHQVLLNPERHLQILDAYAEHDELLSRMAGAAAALGGAFRQLEEMTARRRDRAEREEFLKFQLSEIERVAPESGEDAALEAERKVLTHAEKLVENASEVEQALYTSRAAVGEVLGKAVTRLQEVARIDAEMQAQVEALQGALYTVEDVARSAGAYARGIRFEPGRLDIINSRLVELNRLKRKYHTDLEGILEKRVALAEELETLGSAEERLGALERELCACWREAVGVSVELGASRREVARRLETAVESELQSLSMPKARFAIRVEPRAVLDQASPDRANGPGVRGNDRVEFYFSANFGETVRPVARVASGGELSRLLLSLKRALAGAGEVGTFVFDEVDAGIGGAVAEVVGRKLHEISIHRQLVCITHLSQIAAYADRHFVVLKETSGGRTRSRVEALAEGDRTEEIARMMGGIEITERTRELARELIARCAAFATGRAREEN